MTGRGRPARLPTPAAGSAPMRNRGFRARATGLSPGDSWPESTSADAPGRGPASRGWTTSSAAASPPTASTSSRATPASGKTTLALQFLLEGERLGETGPLRHPLRDQGRARRRGAVARLVARRHRHPRAGRAGGRASSRTTSTRMFQPVRGRARRDDQGRPRARSSGSSPGGSSSTRSRRCGCWPRTRSATAGRSSRSSSSSSAGECTVLLLDDRTSETRGPAAPEHRPRRHRASSSSRPSTGPSGGGCASPSSAGSSTGAATTTSSSQPGGLDVFPRLVAAEHAAAVRARASSRAASPRSTPCWAAASTAAPARSSSARPGAANRRSPSSTPSPPRRAASRPRSSPSTSGWRRSWTRTAGLGMDIAAARRSRAASRIQQIDPAELSPGEFAHRVRAARRERRTPRGSSSSTASTAT